MQLPNMQPTPASNPVSPSYPYTPAGGANTGAPTVPPNQPAPMLGAPLGGLAQLSGAPPGNVNPGAQPPVVQQLSQQGRYGDSTLVHMNPDEVRGLQALAQSQGGSLSINPTTGLPEAFSLGKFLKGLLPTIVGAIATPLTGGLINPMTIAGLTGAAKVASGGNLMEGLTAGLQAYGGAGIGKGLMTAGGAANATGLDALKAMGTGLKNTVMGVPTAATPAAIVDQSRSALPTGTPLPPIGSTTNPLAPAAATPSAGGYNPASGTGLSGITSNPVALPSAISSGAAPFSDANGLFDVAQYPGGENLAVAPAATQPGLLARLNAVRTAGQESLVGQIPGVSKYPSLDKNIANAAMFQAATSPLAAIGAAGAGMGGGSLSQQYEEPYVGPYSFSGAAPVFPGAGSTSSAEFNYFPNRRIGSGYVMPNAAAVQEFLSRRPSSVPKDQRKMLAQQQRQVRMRGYAEGGVKLEDGAFIVDARTVSELGNGSSSAGQDVLAKHGGKPIRGKGDGVSDSIRANIGGKQEARVARDEVKFSPEAVKKIGGGYHKRGVQKLYAMMDKAAKARKAADRGEDTNLRGLMAIR